MLIPDRRKTLKNGIEMLFFFYRPLNFILLLQERERELVNGVFMRLSSRPLKQVGPSY